MDNPAIKTLNLTKSFGDNVAVDNLTLEIQQGELFGLVGPDGAGKTTIMRLLAAIMLPASGEAWVAGHSILHEGEKIKEKIGYMSQRFGLYEDLTVMENILFYADLYEVPKKERPGRIERLLGFSNLTPFKERLAGKLSGGMKQKLGLACALIHTPEVLFLDEPTNGVDPVSRRDFWRILYDLLKEKVTIFVSTAYLDEAERCTRIGLIHKGRLIMADNPANVKKSMPLAMVEVWSPEARKTAEAIKNMNGVKDVSVYGNRFHVTLTEMGLMNAIITQLKDTGVEITDYRSVLPSLEDVFIEMVKSNRVQGVEGSGGQVKENPLDPGTLEPCSPQTLEPSNPDESSGNTAVSVTNLTRNFGDFVAVDNISLSVKKGEIFGFLGPNGAGKSTTIKMLCGLLMPSGGTGFVGGYNIVKQSEEIKRTIGYMSQKFSLYDDLTVEENIDFFSGIYGVPDGKKAGRKEWVLEMAELGDRKTNLTRTLPGGIKQRLALGCAILHEPPIIFLDEPTSGVDPISRRNFWNLIYEMSKSGTTTFVTTHYMDEAEYCDRLALIYRGRIIAHGTPGELKEDYMKRDVLEIEVNKVIEAMDILRMHDIETAIFGSSLHATLEDGDKAIPVIKRVLEEARIEVGKIEKIIPSLEDVFVTLIETS